jgi:aminoglycoside N3'-acetyltransferase
MKVTTGDIRKAIRNLGVAGRPLCVHSSLRSFGWVEGGAQAVVDGLLAEGCPVLVPTFSWDEFGLPPQPGMQPARNGCNYAITDRPAPGKDRIYTPDSRAIDREDMGAIPAAVVLMPRRVRGNHPLCSFTAVGPLAEELMAGQEPLEVFRPLRALSEAGGYVVLMGVGLEAMTLIHLAEQMAGRNLFRRWANGPDGRPIEIETGGCSLGFGKFGSIFAPLTRQSKVGLSTWNVIAAKEALAVAIRAIRDDAYITHCDDAECERCDDAVMGGPLVG